MIERGGGAPAQVACIAFAFMAGEYPAYLVMHKGAHPGCPAAGYASGPRGLALWVGHWGPCYRFEPGFLVLWGARYACPAHQENEKNHIFVE